MNDQQMRRNVDESMTSGAATMLARSAIFPREDLILLATKARAGDQGAYDMLVRGMSRMVFAEAYSSYRAWRSHLPATASFDDVFSAGLMGLHRATMKFEAGRGNAFTSHAKWWIRNECQRAVYDMVGIVHVPRKQLTDKGVRADDPLLHGLSLDHVIESTGRAMHEEVPAREPEDHHDVQMMRAVLDILTCVDERLPEIVKLLQCEHGYREVGRIVGISAERVRQLQAAGAAAVEASGLADEYLDA